MSSWTEPKPFDVSNFDTPISSEALDAMEELRKLEDQMWDYHDKMNRALQEVQAHQKLVVEYTGKAGDYKNKLAEGEKLMLQWRRTLYEELHRLVEIPLPTVVVDPNQGILDIGRVE